jgi:ABC-type nitrate/sulfonate/bicarbonate transport system permease component
MPSSMRSLLIAYFIASVAVIALAVVMAHTRTVEGDGRATVEMVR